jgi:hypothetical protein
MRPQRALSQADESGLETDEPAPENSISARPEATGYELTAAP